MEGRVKGEGAVDECDKIHTEVCAPESGLSLTIAITEEYIDLPIRAKFPALVGMHGNLRCHVQHNHILIIDLKSGSKRISDRPTR